MRSERSRSQLRAEARGVRRAKRVMARPAPSPALRRSFNAPRSSRIPQRSSRLASSSFAGAVAKRVTRPKREVSPRRDPALSGSLGSLRKQLAEYALSRRVSDSRGSRLAAGRPLPAPKRQNLADWASTQVGTKGGSRRQARYANSIPMAASEPWCAAFINYGLKKQGKKGPALAEYSGAWLDWRGGRKVSKPRRGDLVVYDWGDGGRTDHIAIYDGRGRVIGGNQNNKVTVAPARLNQAVGIVRPK